MVDVKNPSSPGAAGALRRITPEALAMLGGPGMAYVRPLPTPEGAAFGIFSADGTQLGQAPSRDVAMAVARQHDLEPVSVH
jgi:hypothetical protein